MKKIYQIPRIEVCLVETTQFIAGSTLSVPDPGTNPGSEPPQVIVPTDDPADEFPSRWDPWSDDLL